MSQDETESRGHPEPPPFEPTPVAPEPFQPAPPSSRRRSDVLLVVEARLRGGWGRLTITDRQLSFRMGPEARAAHEDRSIWGLAKRATSVVVHGDGDREPTVLFKDVAGIGSGGVDAPSNAIFLRTLTGDEHWFQFKTEHDRDNVLNIVKPNLQRY